MDERFLPKTEDRDGRFFHLIEELGEVQLAAGAVQQVLGKCGRFGMASVNPLLPEAEQVPNIIALVEALGALGEELKDLSRAILALNPDIEAELRRLNNGEAIKEILTRIGE